MNFKRYNESDNSWTDSHYIMGTDTDTITSLPTTIYPNASSITVGVKGQSSQASTPSPQNPVDVVGTGERTANEWNVTLLPNSSINVENYWEKYDSSTVSTTMYMSCEANTTYYLYTPSSITSGIFRVYTSTSDTIPTLGNSIPVYEKTRSSSPISVFKFTTGTTDKMLIIQVTTANSQTMANNAVLDKGYKIPISSADTTTPVYLGEVQTTRRIKKLVLTGDEEWYSFHLPESLFIINIADYVKNTDMTICLCTHYKAQKNITLWTAVQDKCVCFYDTTSDLFYLRDSDFSTVADFKSYLAAQYAAGTPVTVWYVLANEETAVVNEPLMKIGNYADSLTTSIPCTAGENTLDVDTTIQPSEVTAGFSGWHPVSAAHERENGQWD